VGARTVGGLQAQPPVAQRLVLRAARHEDHVVSRLGEAAADGPARAHLEENLDAAAVRLGDEDMSRLDVLG
jgi:hypothetical protein